MITAIVNSEPTDIHSLFPEEPFFSLSATLIPRNSYEKRSCSIWLLGMLFLHFETQIFYCIILSLILATTRSTDPILCLLMNIND